jgi:hypothetical protein
MADISRTLIYKGNWAKLYACEDRADGKKWVEKVSPLYMDQDGNVWRDPFPHLTARSARGGHGQRVYPAPGQRCSGLAGIQNGLLAEWALLTPTAPPAPPAQGQGLDSTPAEQGPAQGVLNTLVSVGNRLPDLDLSNDGAPQARKIVWRMPHMWGSLDRWIRHNPSSLERLEQLPTLVRDILAGLSHIHQKGWNHGDLKPANVLVSDKGSAASPARFYVSDFNAALLEVTPRSRPYCTYEYAGPECFGRGVPRADGVDEFLAPNSIVVYRETDLWSLGVIVMEAITGFHYMWASILSATAGMTVADVNKHRTRVKNWVKSQVRGTDRTPQDSRTWYERWWDMFLGGHPGGAEYPPKSLRTTHTALTLLTYGNLRHFLVPFFRMCFETQPERRGTCSDALAAFEAGWAQFRPAGELGLGGDQGGPRPAWSASPAVAAEQEAMEGCPEFVAAWTSLRDTLVRVWIARSVPQTPLTMVDWAVLLPSGMQVWDRWAWHLYAGQGPAFAAHCASLVAAGDDRIHGRVMAHLGMHYTPPLSGAGGTNNFPGSGSAAVPAISVDADQFLLGVMCAWGSALHLAGNWSGSWIMLEDLLVARFRPSPVEKVYEAMEGMLRYFGPEIYTPTITSLLGKRRATGIPKGREFCRVYDEVLRAGDVQARSPFWTWGPAAQQALAGLSDHAE